METIREKKETAGMAVYVAGAAGVLVCAALPFGVGLFALALLISVAGALTGMTLGGLRAMTEVVGGHAAFGWTPSEAYLAGKKGKKGRKA